MDIVISKFFSEIYKDPKKRPTATVSALSQARSKVKWQLLEQMNFDLSKNIEANFKSTSLWHGMNVYGIDTTTVTLPNSKDIGKKFKKHKTFGNFGYYPQAKILLGMNLYNGAIPFVEVDSYEVNDHLILKNAIDKIPEKSLIVGDRGFGGHNEFIILNNKHFYLIRMKAGKNAMSVVRNFANSGMKEKVVNFCNYRNDLPDLEVRLINCGTDSEGGSIILATNLVSDISAEELAKLYLERWQIETLFNRIKNIFKLEKFHSKTINGIMQEIFACIMFCMISYSLVKLATENTKEKFKKYSVKKAITITKLYIINILFNKIETSIEELFEDIINQILDTAYLIRYNRKYPRMSKQPVSKWNRGTNRTAEKNKLKRIR